MRITNKIMQSNSLYNINNNKILQDKLNAQMTTQKKNVRPSDDPVVAIRALRLRSSLSEVTQYHEKNVPDASSWLEVTDSALYSTEKVLEDMYEQCNKGTSDTMNETNREAILTALKKLRDEVYATGDSDYAGRNVFTGYRTGTKLTFQSDTSKNYEITQQLDKNDLDSITRVNPGDLMNVDTTNYGTITTTSQQVSSAQVHRIRLAYDGLNAGGDVKIEYGASAADADGNVTFDHTLSTAAGGGIEEVSLYNATADAAGNKSPYDMINEKNGAGNYIHQAIYIPETGEVLLNDDLYNTMMAAKDNNATKNFDEGEIRVTYNKSEWSKGDLSPVHYFACTSTESDGSHINYNPEYLQGIKEKQAIEYDVGFNQAIQVNTTADEVYTHNIGRDVDEMINILEEYGDINKVVDTLDKLVQADPSDAAAAERLEAAKKAQTLVWDKLHDTFKQGVTKMQGYLDQTSQARTDCGTRGARLELIDNRLESQQTTFDTLASDNENADITKVAIELSSAELSYEAALLATGKVVQTSLLNFL